MASADTPDALFLQWMLPTTMVGSYGGGAELCLPQTLATGVLAHDTLPSHVVADAAHAVGAGAVLAARIVVALLPDGDRWNVFAHGPVLRPRAAAGVPLQAHPKIGVYGLVPADGLILADDEAVTDDERMRWAGREALGAQADVHAHAVDGDAYGGLRVGSDMARMAPAGPDGGGDGWLAAWIAVVDDNPDFPVADATLWIGVPARCG
ncbi:uncharacterized protein AMSG_07607 [Thecamonas trahens ATCC 50062]|uniref:Uncharacterized protein n=1 Tax=Thecamonas trahens ATCC 50062 TaxID=461836 RepID=A0A0L0DJB5_THETB|nr:hypothetical protein AMSG_07607 [Thecamonas trahens ATCC 50062]KNC51418.1 hypothetical protein AMSG_07607 [Thecamonas trahens ATCC 50062]|eukprot:XP_013756084.1 hypothetical protein AMSG_07607 [Thecamonas trahens ATCC 50062]